MAKARAEIRISVLFLFRWLHTAVNHGATFMVFINIVFTGAANFIKQFFKVEFYAYNVEMKPSTFPDSVFH